MTIHNEHLTRQADIIPEEILGEPITIIGAGAIGSWVTLALAKMGFQDITVYDFDRVSVENMNSQFYPFSAIGELKIFALRSLVQDFTRVYINAKPRKYSEGHFPGLVISAVDSMAVRKRIWENHVGKGIATRAIIDPRMGALNALLYVMKPMNERDASSYEKSLYADADAVQERCTAKATIFTANLLSGLVCKAVVDVLTRPDYLRIAQWDIRENGFIGFKANAGLS